MNANRNALNVRDSLYSATPPKQGFGGTTEKERFWQRGFPQLACIHPFLMHSLLAISSLHLAQCFTEAKARFLATAAHHQDLALPAYCCVLSDMQRGTNEERAV